MDHDIESRHLRYLVAGAEEFHFGGRRSRLHLSLPALPQQIMKLEEILGYAVLHGLRGMESDCGGRKAN